MSNRKLLHRALFILVFWSLILSGCTDSEKEKRDMMVLHKLMVCNDIAFWGIPKSRILEREFEKGRVSSDEYKDVLFFLNDKEAEKEMGVTAGDIAEGVVYAIATDATQRHLNALNFKIEQLEIETQVKEYGFEYPITLEDVCNYPLDMYELLNDRNLIPYADYEFVISYP